MKMQSKALWLLSVLAATLVATSFLGRVAVNAAEPAVPAHPIAVCDVIAIANELMQSPPLDQVRKNREQLFQNEMERWDNVIQGAKRHLDMTPFEDPKYDHVVLELIDFKQKSEEGRQQARKQFHDFCRLQFVDAYTKASTLATSIAKRSGFAYLAQSGNPRVSATPGESEQEMHSDLLGRVMLLYPDAVDITGEVRREAQLIK